MTIQQAIGQLDALKPNTFTVTEKLCWLSRLDGQVRTEILRVPAPFDGYTDQTPLSQPLLVPAPYDECYLRYMEAQIDYCNGEISRYQNAMALFNAVYTAYGAWHLRNNTPQSQGFSF